jgi:3D (Asp-Asp-Asp) domain-containing protein
MYSYQLHAEIQSVKDYIKALTVIVFTILVILMIIGIALADTRRTVKAQAQTEAEEKTIEAITTAPAPTPDMDAVVIDLPQPDAKTLGGWQDFTATAYCGCAKCNGEWSDGTHAVSATGAELTTDWSIAADFAVLPPHTVVEIQGVGLRCVDDCGGAIKGNRIDVYFANHDEAMDFGVQHVLLRVCEDSDY